MIEHVISRCLGNAVVSLALIAIGTAAQAVPPSINIYHFDVNTGDATLIVSPDGRAVLIDAGDRGRGHNPIAEFLDRARQNGGFTSLDYTIATHYDADHIGGMDEVYGREWYPRIAALDRGNENLPRYDRAYVTNTCHGVTPTTESRSWHGAQRPPSNVRRTGEHHVRSSSTCSQPREAAAVRRYRQGTLSASTTGWRSSR